LDFNIDGEVINFDEKGLLDRDLDDQDDFIKEFKSEGDARHEGFQLT
jgi:hypothetical protein